MSANIPVDHPDGRVNPAEEPVSARLWHWYGGLVLGFTSVMVLTGGRPVPRALGAVALLAALAAGYAAVGRRLVPVGRGTRAAAAFLGLVFAAFVPAVVLAPEAAYLLWAVCPLAFQLLRLAPAVCAVSLFNAVPVVCDALRHHDLAGAVRAQGPPALGALAFGFVISAWIDQIVRQSEDRAELIAELRATRAEVARLSHEAGMVAERQRLAADLHDTVAQGLSSVVMLIQAAGAGTGAAAPQEGASGRRHLDLAERTARECLAETRALVGALTPAPLSGASLGDAISRLVRRFDEETGVQGQWRLSGPARPLPVGTEVVVLRAVQEALANVRKHAAATRAAVCLTYRPDEVELEVTDDGCGLPPDPMARGYGLRGMSTRVAQAGGRLRLDEGAGTRLRVVIPA
ncbi:sensor histidine kinase [Dactylosporangium sp. NPDC000521]|uniref:sensor histidine kinase n=1 Tax=Dactylosporangium sp. NPDC000521 TaxID=3363975 RepID=UPI0036C9ADE2